MQKNVWISCQVSAATSAAQMPLAIPSSATTHPPGRNSAEEGSLLLQATWNASSKHGNVWVSLALFMDLCRRVSGSVANGQYP